MSESSDIQRLSKALADRGALKLWSVIVTILGDMGEGGYAEIPGPLLSALIEEMGLQPQAMRVALHRLRKDAWVENRKAARIGYYALSARGATETRKVTDRVYGAAVEVLPVLAVLPQGGDTPEGSVMLARQTVLVAAGDVPEDAMVSPCPAVFPEWADAILQDAAGCEAYADYLGLLSGLDERPDDPLKALTLRFLVLHGWRRLVLRANPLAEAALGPDTAAVACRARVGALLARLPRLEPKNVTEKAD